jgi:hypothetical protein
MVPWPMVPPWVVMPPSVSIPVPVIDLMMGVVVMVVVVMGMVMVVVIAMMFFVVTFVMGRVSVRFMPTVRFAVAERRPAERQNHTEGYDRCEHAAYNGHDVPRI